jgi:hypothetical protein
LKCKICVKEASNDGYCESHTKAYEVIVKKYESWRRALDISWKEYLSEVAKNPLTGAWAQEVAEHLSKFGEKQDGKTT